MNRFYNLYKNSYSEISLAIFLKISSIISLEIPSENSSEIFCGNLFFFLNIEFFWAFRKKLLAQFIIDLFKIPWEIPQAIHVKIPSLFQHIFQNLIENLYLNICVNFYGNFFGNLLRGLSWSIALKTFFFLFFYLIGNSYGSFLGNF